MSVLKIKFTSLTITLLATCGIAGCQDPVVPTPGTSTASVPGSATATPPEEKKKEPHLADLKQITFGGENAEAYWSWSGKELILQARETEKPGTCDRIYRMDVSQDKPTQVPVSSGKGTTTCSFFLPGDSEVIYASTHLGGDACPPKPDHSLGYVWPLYDTYDIFKTKPDGSGSVQLTKTPGYDAEGTVCKKDGTILFTSVRDGDIDLYTMKPDGSNVKRLTKGVGYDGGAFFNNDCTKIVWRASRPEGKDLEDYQRLLKQNLVRPSKLELFVANADGSDAQQVTYLDAASFGPYFTPDSKRILFSTNYGDPKGREFDIWAVNVDGTQLERITEAPGFDGFPMFSPDGKTLAFSSNRATAEGKQDTNVFLARWVNDPIVATQTTAADRVAADATWLADPKREGRGVGTAGLEESGKYIEDRFREIGLVGSAKGDGSFRQLFNVAVSLSGSAKVAVDGKDLEGAVPLSFSQSQSGVSGELVLANYGVEMDGYSDYKGLDVKGKIVVVRRFVPDTDKFGKPDVQRRHGDLRRKARLAHEKGAKAIIIVDYPVAPAGKKGALPDEAKIPSLNATETASDAQIPSIIVTRASFSAIVDRLVKKEKIQAKLDVSVKAEEKSVFNVVGKLAARGTKKAGTIVIGAHYDHLGMGGHGSLAPDQKVVHPGADDNASGTAALIEIARGLAAADVKLDRDVVFVAFSGEERGVLGSNFFTKNAAPGLTPADLSVMINLDMVGRVQDNRIDLVGHDTAKELGEIVDAACKTPKQLRCTLEKGGGYGPSDHASFYAAGVPVLFLFSGTHSDYHKPSDTADKLNNAGIAASAKFVQEITKTLAARDGKLTYVNVPSPPPKGDPRSFGSSLGTIPDYAASGEGKGVVLAGVRPGGAAEKGGMQRGDRLTKIGRHEIASVEDLMFVLNESKPGSTVDAEVTRDGKKVKLKVTFQESKRQ